MGSSTWSQGMHLPNTNTLSSRSTLLDPNAKSYTNYDDVAPYSDNQFYQHATIHGYQLAKYPKGTNGSGSSIPLDTRRRPISSNPTINNFSTMTVGRCYYDPTTIVGSDSGGSSAYLKKLPWL